MSEINQRNAETVRLTLKSMAEKIEQQQIQINGLVSSLSTINSVLSETQRQLFIMRALASGNGPTSK